jgi:alcohol dehydrogenase (NADP+)
VDHQYLLGKAELLSRSPGIGAVLVEVFIMIESPDFRTKRIPLNHGAGHMPVLGFGTLIPDAAVTISTTRDALEAGFRHFDCAERHRNEREVGEALQAGLAAGAIAREGIFVTTKLWNTNHRPERVEPAFEASLDRLRLNYLDLYLIHTPFGFNQGTTRIRGTKTAMSFTTAA